MKKHQIKHSPFFLPDLYAGLALGSHHQTGSSFIDPDIYVAARGFSGTVIPDIDEAVLGVVGDVAAEAASVRDRILGRWHRRELWNQPSLPMELQWYASQLLQRGDLFYHLSFGTADDGTYELQEMRWLPPETLVTRTGDRTRYEQFASWRAYGNPDLSIAGTPVDHYEVFREDEIFHLSWPLDIEDGGSRSQVEAVRHLETAMSRASYRGMLVSRAGADRGETFWSVARARSGAYADSLKQKKALSAKAMDMLFYPGADEAEAFPWVDDSSAFFMADRMLRSRVAITRVRDYLFTEFNRQVLGVWTRLNDWSEVRLQLSPALFSVEDWLSMRRELHSGSVDLEDVKAAIHAEAEVVRAARKARSDRSADLTRQATS